VGVKRGGAVELETRSGAGTLNLDLGGNRKRASREWEKVKEPNSSAGLAGGRSGKKKGQEERKGGKRR